MTYSTACRPQTRGTPVGLVLLLLPPRLSPSPPRNCLPKSSVVWVAFAVACNDWLAIATGSPGAPALIVGGKVGSHPPSSAFAGPARPISRATAARVGQTSPARRNPLAFSDERRLKQRRIDPSRASVLDVADYVGRHAAGADRCDPDLQPDVGGLEHLTLTEIDRHVLATAGTVENHVATAHLRRRDLATQVVLRARVMRQLDAHPGERIQHQARAVEADSAGPRVDAPARPRGSAATPGVRHAQLREPSANHVLGGLPSVHPRNAAVGEAGGCGSQPQLLQEAAAHIGGDLRRGRRTPQELVEDRDGVTRDVGAGHHRQRGIPLAGPLAAVAPRRAGRTRRCRIPAVTGGRPRPRSG